ncbi:unnamed protein product [Staurois parvus]|uniref:Uncharacterized protein n=1 Tax=Staurois parvus TaxID=386267 RepID=A0ABN9GF42_9NEOB|nr:unnamed protein product [Staurois parvus]
MCAHQSAPLHQVSPSQCHLTPGIPVKVPPYTQSTPFHHISPSECPFSSYFSIRVPLYIIFPHQSAPLHHMCQSECPFPHITCAHPSAS